MKYKTEIFSFCFALAVGAIVCTACAFIEKASNKYASRYNQTISKVAKK